MKLPAAPPPTSDDGAGRGVLHGAFTLLEALSHAHHGLGLAELTRASGLAKTSVHRLAEQLVAVNAVQRVDQRYFIGPTVGRLGHCWQPDPLLRRACEEPIRKLSALTGATATVYVLHLQHARLVTSAEPDSHSWVPPREFDAAATLHAAVGRVLLAPHPWTEQPTAIPHQVGGQAGAGLADRYAVVTEGAHSPAGCCSAAAPIWRADGDCAGAAAVFLNATPPGRVIDLLVHTTHRIGEALQAAALRSAG